MDILEESYIFVVESQFLIEMSNLPTRLTNLGPTIMVSSKYGHSGQVSQHGPRIKVSNVQGRFAHDDHFVMTVGDEPKVIGNCKLKSSEISDIKDWVLLNRKHLENVWNNGLDLDPQDLLDGFQKLS